MTQKVEPLYRTFQDIDGQPLESGYIYVGTATLPAKTNQITIYSDPELTTVLAQPVRTAGGYAMLSGSPTNIYANVDDFSIDISNKNNTTVYSSGVNPNDFFNIGLTGSVSRSISSKLSDHANVKDFGATGDGVTDDVTAITAALAATAGVRGLYFPAGTYICSSGLIVASLGGITWSGDGAELSVIKFTGAGTGNHIYFNAVQSFDISNLGINYNNASFTGTVFKVYQTSRGKFDNVFIHGDNEGSPSGIRTAAFLLDMDESIEIKIDRSRFSGANYLVQGQRAGGAGYCNAIQIDCCDFDGYIAGAIYGVGQSWAITGCAFENAVDLNGYAIVNTATTVILGLSFTGNWLGDATAGSGNYSWIVLNGKGISIVGNYINGHGNLLPTAVEINASTEAFIMTGNFISSFATAINVGSSLLANSTITANSYAAITTGITGVLGNSSWQYNSGTWVPDLRFAGVNTGITYSTQSGSWTRKGDEVTVYFDMQLTSKGAAAGAAAIYGLPFTSAAIVGTPMTVGIQVAMTAAITFENRIEDSNTIATLGKPTGTGTGTVANTDITNTTRLAGSATYKIG